MQILRPGTVITTVWNTYLRADYATWEPGQTCEIHSHLNAAEIFVILSGAAEFWVEGETAVVPSGSVGALKCRGSTGKPLFADGFLMPT